MASPEQLKGKGIWINPLNTHTFKEKQAEFNWCIYDKKDIAKSIKTLKEKIAKEPQEGKIIQKIDEVFGDFET